MKMIKKILQITENTKKRAAALTLVLTSVMSIYWTTAQGQEENILPDNRLWIVRWLQEDNAGVLQRTRERLEFWQTNEEYEEQWSLGGHRHREVATEEMKKNFISRQLLRFLDKQLMSDVKKSKKGSGLHAVKSARQAIRPSAKVQLASNIKFKFRARVLQGEGRIIVENPYVDCFAWYNYQGEGEFVLGKRVNKIGLASRFVYSFTNENLMFEMTKVLSRHFSTTYRSVASSQNLGNPHQRLQLNFRVAF